MTTLWGEVQKPFHRRGDCLRMDSEREPLLSYSKMQAPRGAWHGMQQARSEQHHRCARVDSIDPSAILVKGFASRMADDS